MIEEELEHQHIEDENYFISMTDMMVGLVFIFIILLMYFALQFRQTSEELNDAQRQLMSANETRTMILRQLQNDLKEKGVQVTIDENEGLLRLPDEILFDSARAEFKPEGRAKISYLAEGLVHVLPCYSDGLPKTGSCPPGAHKIEAVFIEGHTDRDPLEPTLIMRDNWDLSVARATNTFRALIASQPELTSLCLQESPNKCVPVIGVSGYADTRPVDSGQTNDAKARNRRIDIRILMAGPRPRDLTTIDRQLRQ